LQAALQIPGQKGFWEFGAAAEVGKPAQVFTTSIADGFAAPKPTATITRDGTHTRYALSLSLKELGLTVEQLTQGIRFSILVNDNDGEGRDGWIELTPGIGEMKTPGSFAWLVEGAGIKN
jgi:hypothetical protein